MTSIPGMPPGTDYRDNPSPRREAEAAPHSEAPSLREAVAVTGMSCLFPGSSSVLEFWENLEACREFVAEIPPGRFDGGDRFDPDSRREYSPTKFYGSFLDRIDEFDAEFFQISPREAARMDPQQRILL